jgi:hypothetical protein
MTLTTPSLATVTPGQPVTAQGWNALVNGLAELYEAVIALGGEALDVTVTRAVGTGAAATTEPFPSAEVVAEPLGEGRPVRALPPFGSRTAHLLAGLTDGNWRVHIEAPGHTAEVRELTLPNAAPIAVTLQTAGVATPDLFGLGLRAALDALRAQGVDADLVLDTTGREISRVAVPAEYVDSPVLAQLPATGTVIPAGSGRVRIVVSSALRRDPVVTMPSLIGLTVTEAQTTLNKLGLQVGTTTFRETAENQ